MGFVYLNLTKAGRCQETLRRRAGLKKAIGSVEETFRDRSWVVALGQQDMEPGWG